MKLEVGPGKKYPLSIALVCIHRIESPRSSEHEPRMRRVRSDEGGQQMSTNTIDQVAVDRVKESLRIGMSTDYIRTTVLRGMSADEIDRAIEQAQSSVNGTEESESGVIAEAQAAAELSKLTPTFKDLAEPLIQRGIPVIPLLPGTKKAFSNEWPTLATTDQAQVLRWDAEYPTANIGCVGLAKPDGICFFEIDDPALYHRIEQETGQKFPKTFRVRSSPGKGHIYFRHTASTIELANKKAYYSLKNSDGSEACSARLNHAYVVGPGSIHPETHKPYEIVSLAAVADFPEWLVEWIKKNLEPRRE